ncbi:MAG: hypothetical protein WCP20_14810 [Desulfuromonadales bacterium]
MSRFKLMHPCNLSKSKIIEGLQCRKRLWLTVNRPECAEVSDETNERLQAGLALHDVFRTLYPDGKFVKGEQGLGKALQETERLVQAGELRIFEATFSHQGVLIRADLLEKDNASYKLYEAKSSTSVKDYHVPDISIQAWVIGNNIPLSTVHLTHIDNSFVYPGGNDYRGLFQSEDVTEQVNSLRVEIPKWVSDFREMLTGSEPEIMPGDQCYSPFECPYCLHCSPAQSGFEYPTETLPGATRIELQLLDEGFTDLRNVPRSG